jgi:hypothetical protein
MALCVYPQRIDIISFPGLLPPLDKYKPWNLQIDVRKYHNRRIAKGKNYWKFESEL